MFLRYLSITVFGPIHVRDTEVPGSNPVSPTTEAAVQRVARVAGGPTQRFCRDPSEPMAADRLPTVFGNGGEPRLMTS
jgi:hypothetical protein